MLVSGAAKKFTSIVNNNIKVEIDEKTTSESLKECIEVYDSICLTTTG